jgi:hypothetical protein
VIPGFVRVQDFRCCTDFELQQVIAQAAVAAYILEQRELIAGMVRDHGAALDHALTEVRELRDRVAMYERLYGKPHESLLAPLKQPEGKSDLTYEPAAEGAR